MTMKLSCRYSFHMLMLVCCVAVFVWQQRVGIDASVDAAALYGPKVADGQWWRMVTSGFMHLNVAHIVLNVASLVMLGRLLEPLYDAGRRWRFPLLYVGSLLGGAAGVLLVEFDLAAIGASGAVFGLLGAAIALPARIGSGLNRFGVLPWLVGNLAFTFVVPGISVGGHLGGLVAGFILGWLLTPASRLHDYRREPLGVT
jgi:membrane associated rhomboid family serine protease